MSNTESNILERLESALNPNARGGFRMFIKEARKPLILLILSLSIAFFALYNSLYNLQGMNKQNADAQTRNTTRPTTHSSPDTIYIDLSGSVNNPHTYKLKGGARLFELIELAGGLSPEADRGFIQRNYNFAVILNDQQKVHIPSVFEVRDGRFTERDKLVTLDLNSKSSVGSQSANSNLVDNPSLISLNDSTLEELKVLPGVGDVIGQQIMAARPYSQVNDLLTKGIVKQSLYDKISQMLEP